MLANVWHGVYSSSTSKEWTYCGYRGFYQTRRLDQVTCAVCLALMDDEGNGKEVAPNESARIVRAMGG